MWTNEVGYRGDKSDGRTFFQVASDGGFLRAPVPLSRLLLSPAERAEILVDLGSDQGTTLKLRSFNGGLGTSLVPFPLQDAWDNSDFDLLEIEVGAARANAVLTIPAALATVEEIPEIEAVNALSPTQILRACRQPLRYQRKTDGHGRDRPAHPSG